jgi:SEC-C motif-containing protein
MLRSTASSGQENASTAEALMRSRYSAYVLEALRDYLLATWHVSSTRPSRARSLSRKRQQMARSGTSNIMNNRMPGRRRSNLSPAIELPGAAHRLHETSRFVREDGRWYYLDGEFDGAINAAG